VPTGKAVDRFPTLYDPAWLSVDDDQTVTAMTPTGRTTTTPAARPCRAPCGGASAGGASCSPALTVVADLTPGHSFARDAASSSDEGLIAV
jgi:hypothetical protein